MISIKDLAFSYGTHCVLKNISLELEEGKIYGLLGENGVGKTTLLTLLAGLKKVSAGIIETDGKDPYKRDPSMLCSQYYLPDEVVGYNMTAAQYAGSAGNFWPGFSMDRFKEIMQLFETDCDMKMNKMSSGQLKKTYISLALSCGAKYLFLDEPTNGLDIPSKSAFRSALMKYTDEKSTIIISTHQVKDLENIIDPIIILDNSSILLNASIEEIGRKLFFDYGTELHSDALYMEQVPGGYVQVCLNQDGRESKINLEALFNTVHKHKELFV